MPVPGDALFEALDHREEAPRGLEVLDGLQDVVLGPDQLVRLSQIGDAAVPDDLPTHPRHQRIRRDSRESIGPTALQPDLELRGRFLGAPRRVYLLEPFLHDRFGLFEIPPETPLQAHERVGHIVYGIAVIPEVVLEHPVRYGLPAAVVEHDPGPDVRVDHKPAQGPQEQVQVVRRALLPAFGVGDADYTVHVLVGVGDAVHLQLQRPDKPGEPRREAHYYHVVARTDAPIRAAPVTHERARLVVERNLLAGAEALFVEDVGLELRVAEVRLFRQAQAAPLWFSTYTSPALVRGPFRMFVPSGRDPETLAQYVQDLLVARVVSRRDVPDSAAEAETPGDQVLSFCYRLDGETVSFEDSMLDGELDAFVRDARPGLEPARRHGHVVARCGKASDFPEVPRSFLHGSASHHPCSDSFSQPVYRSMLYGSGW